MKNFLVKKFTLLVLALLLALMCGGIAYAIATNELPTAEISFFHYTVTPNP
ncbi:MAG: hypothetical protein WBC55_01940 [Dehalococcoidia bacterium]